MTLSRMVSHPKEVWSLNDANVYLTKQRNHVREQREEIEGDFNKKDFMCINKNKVSPQITRQQNI